jgi:transcriptional regulator GlxA family with amidase domain
LNLLKAGEAMIPKTVGLIVFEQMAADELTGPAEVFSRTRISTSDDREFRCYQVSTLGVGTARCVTECGVIVKPQLDVNDAPPLDTLIIPGGSGIHDARLSKKITKWLSRRVAVTRRVAALGTSIYVLAATGLLDRRQVATHWRFAKDVAARFPSLRVTSNHLFVKDGPFYTCAGGTSAVDLALSLIQEDYGRQTALKLARDLVLHLKRSGEQNQCSEPLQFQLQSCDRFADISTWILCNLNQDLSVEALAEKACMSPRNFSRLFKAAFGKAPAEFVAGVRIAEAQRRLQVPRNTIESVANSVGFQSTDAFSRAFEREVGCRPSTYRMRRGAVGAPSNFWRPRKAFGVPRCMVRT